MRWKVEGEGFRIILTCVHKQCHTFVASFVTKLCVDSAVHMDVDVENTRNQEKTGI